MAKVFWTMSFGDRLNVSVMDFSLSILSKCRDGIFEVWEDSHTEFKMPRIHIPFFNIFLLCVIYTHVQECALKPLPTSLSARQLLSKMPDVLSYIVLHHDRMTNHVIKVK